MESLLYELFLDSANEYEVKHRAREMKMEQTNINLENMKRWSMGVEFRSLSSIVERNNIMCVLDGLNRAFVKSVTVKEKTKKPSTFSTRAVEYYNPYEGMVDISKVTSTSTGSNFVPAEFLDRTKSSFYKKNKSTRFKCMNARLNTISDSEGGSAVNNLEFEDSNGELENNYYLTKKLKVNM
jgi:hypothetical protein